eukprot:2079430-Rhodomonas_salina.1
MRGACLGACNKRRRVESASVQTERACGVLGKVFEAAKSVRGDPRYRPDRYVAQCPPLAANWRGCTRNPPQTEGEGWGVPGCVVCVWLWRGGTRSVRARGDGARLSLAASSASPSSRLPRATHGPSTRWGGEGRVRGRPDPRRHHLQELPARQPAAAAAPGPRPLSRHLDAAVARVCVAPLLGESCRSELAALHPHSHPETGGTRTRISCHERRPTTLVRLPPPLSGLGWMEGSLEEWIEGRMEGRKEGWIDGWMDGWTDERMAP